MPGPDCHILALGRGFLARRHFTLEGRIPYNRAR